MKKDKLIKQLVELHREFITDMLEEKPNYDYEDYNFNTFMHWIRKKHFNN